jgi:hypothetical protein
MAKPAITKRAVKGSPLTYAELDTNFQNLQDATITLKAGSGGTDVVSDLNGTITLVAGSNITLSGDNTAKTVTINSLGADVVNDLTPQLGGNLDVNGFSIVSVSNGNIVLAPNGTGLVQLDSDTVRVGDLNATANITTNGTGDLRLSTNNDDASSGSITIQQGSNNSIQITPDGTGVVVVGSGTGQARLASSGPYALTLLTAAGTGGGGSIDIAHGTDSSITLTTNGFGAVYSEGQNLIVGKSSASTTASISSAVGITKLNISDGVNTITLDETVGITIDTDPGKNIKISAGTTNDIELDGALKIRASSGTPTTYENGYYEDMLQTPVSWLKISIGGSFYYLPLFQ